MENYIFQKSTEARILFLYQNSPCVVIGRNQNPLVECNLLHLQKNNIPVIRRYSGGGTVYHDLGNLNYSLMTPKDEFQRVKGVTFIKEALNYSNINTVISDRNDLLIRNAKGELKKISGSAFKLAARKCYHHGTLLCQSALSDLKIGLHADEVGIDSSAVTSVSMSVANLEISVKNAVAAIVKYADGVYSKGKMPLILDTVDPVKETRYLTSSDFEIGDVTEHIDQLNTFDWTFERTPKFKQDMVINGRPESFEVRNLIIIKSLDEKWLGKSYLDLCPEDRNAANLIDCLNRYKTSK